MKTEWQIKGEYITSFSSAAHSTSNEAARAPQSFEEDLNI